jgi:Protein of unknown function (DUF1579)
MRSMIAMVAASAAVFSGAAAFAQTAPAPAAPKPAPQMAQLNAFTGTWSCFGNQADSVFGTEHPIDTLQVGTVELGGFWVVVRYTELLTGDNEDPSTGTYTYGYDGKQFMATWVDNFGGWGTQTSPGWEGNKLVLVGDYNSNGQKIPARDTFEQASTNQIVHTSELQANGDWVTLQSETCSKQ